jgi:hypothetical protein
VRNLSLNKFNAQSLLINPSRKPQPN